MMQKTESKPFITEDMTVGDVIFKWPDVAVIFSKYGLSCIGCSVNTMEAVGVGARGHGMTEENIRSMIKESNDFVAQKESGGHADVHKSGGTVTITEVASKKVADLMKSQNKTGGLRVGVTAGGCSGYTYQLEFVEKPNPDDTVLEQHGVKVIINQKSMEMLGGATIDFVDSLQGSGFKIGNPNSHGSCGCGKSFS